MSDTTTAPVEDVQAPNLSIADIQNAIRVIDFACEQGAFKGWPTIEQVLILRNRLHDFVVSVAPPEATEEATAEGETGDYSKSAEG